jgi:hypothetical protein
MTLTAGYAQAPITPSLERPVYLAGFGHNRRALSVHDELFVRALALSDLHTTVVLAAVDLIGLPRARVQEIERIVQQTAPATALVVAATHTHHGPDTLGLWGPDEATSGVDEVYLTRLVQTIAATAVAAIHHLQPAAMRATTVQVAGIARNARDEAIRDEALSCLQLVTAGSDEPQATLLVYPCHPEVLWDGNPHITSDYLAAMRRVVEHATRAPCLGMVGALGGMMTPAMPGNTFEDAERMGTILGEAALAALAAACTYSVDAVGYHRHVYTVPLENPLLHMALQTGLLAGVLDADGTLATEASLLHLGDTAIFFMPGEVLPRLGLAYKEQMYAAGMHHAILVGLANDELGYILPADDFVFPDDPSEPGAHYEESMSVGISAGPALSAALARLLTWPDS